MTWELIRKKRQRRFRIFTLTTRVCYCSIVTNWFVHVSRNQKCTELSSSLNSGCQRHVETLSRQSFRFWEKEETFGILWYYKGCILPTIHFSFSRARLFIASHRELELIRVDWSRVVSNINSVLHKRTTGPQSSSDDFYLPWLLFCNWYPNRVNMM